MHLIFLYGHGNLEVPGEQGFKMRKVSVRGGVTGAAVAALVVSGAVFPAHGETIEPAQLPASSPSSGLPAGEIDQDTVAAAVANLEVSDFERATTIDGSSVITTYDLGSGIKLAVSQDRSRLGGGWGPYGLYVDLNRTDRGIIASGGAGALAVALCALPGVGIPLCAVATGVFVAAAAAIAAHGLCGNVLRIHVQQLGYPQCV
ncbi:hypothetical protein HOW07_07630 [Plantibacter sp. MCCC 1A11337]|uniref:hypothetical protein n=1 Tax=Plantibacter sp. MCCC 1A11337 TaxID=2736644 RepID=UPI0015823615|nr:hypothetical protein [Plantibacter sp. MCCC 1A11337]NUJ87875.1 hypothetical protein [Plantibacter sp. MCCC 1A11337]